MPMSTSILVLRQHQEKSGYEKNRYGRKKKDSPRGVSFLAYLFFIRTVLDTQRKVSPQARRPLACVERSNLLAQHRRRPEPAEQGRQLKVFFNATMVPGNIPFETAEDCYENGLIRPADS